MTESAVTNQVLKKLSALRATLTDEEQAVLDSLIISGEDDVEAHRMKVYAAKLAADEDDTEAHALPTGAKLQPRIIFNPETEVYFIE